MQTYDDATRERTAKALFDLEARRIGHTMLWDQHYPVEPYRSKWFRTADVAISAMLGNTDDHGRE